MEKNIHIDMMTNMASGAEPDNRPATMGVEAVMNTKNATKNTDMVRSRFTLRFIAIISTPKPVIRAILTHMEIHESLIQLAGGGNTTDMSLLIGGMSPISHACTVINTEAMTIRIAIPRERIMRVKFNSLRVMSVCLLTTSASHQFLKIGSYVTAEIFAVKIHCVGCRITVGKRLVDCVSVCATSYHSSA